MDSPQQPLQVSEIIILDYAPAYKQHFRELNHEWITKYFELEELDLLLLNDPEKHILTKGGHILFACYQHEIVGTCALLQVTDELYELGKMAVTAKLQGLKIGQKLCETAINKAKALDASALELYSHRSLQSALHVYRKLGFREVPCPPSSYKRSDIKMVLSL